MDNNQFHKFMEIFRSIKDDLILSERIFFACEILDVCYDVNEQGEIVIHTGIKEAYGLDARLTLVKEKYSK